METLAFHDKFYIGCKDRAAFNTEDPPLAFATQFGTDAATAKRLATVRQWVDGYYYSKPKVPEGEYDIPLIDNEFLTGFTFDKVVERWNTSNKWFRVNDPRGFQLEISAENLADLINNCVIERGELKDPVIWAKNGAKVWLCRRDHPDFVLHLKPKISRKDLQLGDIVNIGRSKNRYQYIGEFAAFCVDLTYGYYKWRGRYYSSYPSTGYGHYGYSWNKPITDNPVEARFLTWEKHSKVRIFRLVEDKDSGHGKGEFFAYGPKSSSKIRIVDHARFEPLILDGPTQIDTRERAGISDYHPVIAYTMEELDGIEKDAPAWRDKGWPNWSWRSHWNGVIHTPESLAEFIKGQ